MFTPPRRNRLPILSHVPIRLMLASPLLVVASLALLSPPAKADALNLAEHSVCIAASRAGQTLARRVDCGADATECRIEEGLRPQDAWWKTPGYFSLQLSIHPWQADYVLLHMRALGGVVRKTKLGEPRTTTAESLTSPTGFQAGIADPTGPADQYDGTAVFRLVPKGAPCESQAAAPAAAASGAPSPGQSWSDWFWSWFE